MLQHVDHWGRIPSKGIENVRLKEFNKSSTGFSLKAFRLLFDGTPNWPMVMDGFDASGHRRFPTSGCFRLCDHYSEALIQQTADSRGRILGLKS
jgi:hypothetical protein